MEGQVFIFALQDKLHRFWGVDESGNVTISSQPYFLKFSPDGWNDITVQNVKNKKYWGIDRSVSVPLSYVQDGGKILKHIFYTKGIEESVYLSIGVQELDYTAGVDYRYWYRQIFKGEVDLSTHLHAGLKVTYSTLEDGLPKFLKSNENTVYELDMNVPEAVWVKMDGIILHEKGNYAVTDGINYVSLRSILSFIITSIEGDHYGVSMVSQIYEEFVASTPNRDNLDDNSNYFFFNEGIVDIDINIKGTLSFKSTNNHTSPLSSSEVYVAITRYNGFNEAIQVPIIPILEVVENVTYTRNIDVNITVHPGERLFMFNGTNTNGHDTDEYNFEFLPDSNLAVTFISRKQTTYIRALTAQYLFSRLVNKFTEANYLAAASAYFTKYAQKVFTCGNAIRGLENPVMKISWSTFFKDWDCFDSPGIVDNGGVIDFDTKENLTDFTNKIQLRAPAEGSFKVSVAKEFLFNEAEYGYPEIKNEIGQLNGNEEFNSKFLWSFGATKSPAKLDKVSPIKASCYEIEKIRTTNLEKDTTDYKDDNDLFSLYLEPTSNAASGSVPEHYKLDRSLNASATGLIEPMTVFNLALSPKRNLIRNGPFMRSSMYLADQLTLKYQSSDRNKSLVCDGIVESADVPVPNMGSKFFLPLILEGDFPAPENLEVLLDLNPKQIFTFPLDGYDYDGIFLKVSVAPSKRDVQNYQFLSTAYNPIEKLIEYYG